MARIQITDLNSSDSELSYELSEQELQSVVGGEWVGDGVHAHPVMHLA
ncbi:MAG: bacteriocin [Nostoc sp.]